MRNVSAKFTMCSSVEHAVYANVGNQLEPAFIVLLSKPDICRATVNGSGGAR